MFRDKTEGEIDLLGVHGGKYLAGEVKTNAREFTNDKIDWDMSKSAWLRVDMRLLASVTPIPRAALDYARDKATAQGLELLVMSAAELRPEQK